MSLEAKSLEFGEFLLESDEKVLLRNGERLPINPKTYQLLVTLIENHGHLVGKDQLIGTLWPDSFVEDANLTFTVSLLRKALGDDAQNPRYIETVPRRGYRFVADVRERSEVVVGRQVPQPFNKLKTGGFPLRLPFIAVAALLVAGTIVSGLWNGGKNSYGNVPILSAEFDAEKLSADGNVRSSAISPDGKYVAYTNRIKDKESVWLRDLESSTSVQIIPPSENLYFELAISPDGRTLYFARVQINPAEGQEADIYSVSIFGGVPAKIISQTQGSISLSADGKTISFRRCPYLEEEYCSLWIADSIGGNESRLLSQPSPIRIGDNVISPDAKAVAFAVGQSGNWANEFSLAEVEIETGKQREITPERFFNIKHMAWLPDQRGLLMTAKRFPDNNYRIWYVSARDGEVNALTNDADDYAAMSLTSDAAALVSTKNRADYQLNVYASEFDLAQPRRIAEAASVSFAPDGKIFFSSEMTGNLEIWTVNADGSEQRQLTNHPGVDLDSVVSPDNKIVFFDSNRTGEAQVWRMNIDGTDQRQLTFSDGGTPRWVSPDGKWLYYVSGRARKLSRVPTEGGGEESVGERRYTHLPVVSPDFSRMAFSEIRDKRMAIVIVTLEERTIQTFEVSENRSGRIQLAWSSDGESLFYVAPDDRSEKLVVWRQPLDGKMRIPIVDLGTEVLRETRSFALSPDGRSFAVIQGSWKHDAVLMRGLR